MSWAQSASVAHGPGMHSLMSVHVVVHGGGGGHGSLAAHAMAAQPVQLAPVTWQVKPWPQSESWLHAVAATARPDQPRTATPNVKARSVREGRSAFIVAGSRGKVAWVGGVAGARRAGGAGCVPWAFAETVGGRSNGRARPHKRDCKGDRRLRRGPERVPFCAAGSSGSRWSNDVTPAADGRHRAM